MQKRHKSIANALELRLTCTKTSSLQNKCRTADPDRQNLSQSGKLSFFIIYKFWQSCASVWQVSDLILKTGHRNELLPQPGRKAPRGVSQVETMEQSNIDLIMKSYWDRTTVKPLIYDAPSPEMGRGEGSVTWLFTPTQREWLKTIKWYPTGVCLTFEYPTRGCTWGEKGV